jgi:hypothetical protein
MKRTTNARIAGYTFLIYIAAGITSMALFAQASSGDDVTAQLATIAQNATKVRITVLLDLIANLSALVLAVTLYALTRDTDPDLAMLGMICRVAEGVVGIGASSARGLLWLAATTQAGAQDAADAQVLGAFLLKVGAWSGSSIFFAVGSTLFALLLLRGRLIPAGLAWLGVISSILLVVCLPLNLAGLLSGQITTFMWLPMLLFEVPLALWLIVRGTASPSR